MSAPQEAVDLQEPVVAIGRVAHHLVGPDQAAEAVHVDRRRGHAFGFVDHQARQEATVAVEATQPVDQFLVRVAAGARTDDALRGVEHIGRHDAGERAFAADPHVRRVHHPQLLQLERHPVVDVVADVLLVGQHLVHGGARPVAAEIGLHAHAVESASDFGLDQAVVDEPAVDVVDDADLVVGPRHQDHAIGLQALVLAPRQFGLDGALHVDKGSPQPIARRAALSEAQLDQPTLAGEHFGRQLSAVLACHGALDALHDGRHRRAVVFELLGAVGDLDAGAAADVLVVRTLVGVLKPAPSADVVDQDDLEVGAAVLNVGDQALQCLAAVDAQATLSFVGVGLDDLDATTRGVLTDLVALVLGRVLLVLGRHANVLSPTHS